MTAWTLGLNQTATYIPPGPVDVHGQRAAPAAPVVIRCRWQDVAQVFRSPSGEELTSSSVVYPDRELEVGGYLILGDQTDGVDSDGMIDPRNVGALEIRGLGRSPTINADVDLHKAYL